MEEHEEIPRWDDNSNIPDTPSRRPIINSTINSIQSLNLRDEHQANVSQAQESPPIKSTLSPNAKEFVPASRKVSSLQDRLLRVKQKQEPKEHESTSEIVKSNGVYENENESELSMFTMEVVQQLINCLIDDPGQFDGLLGQFIDVLMPYHMDVTVMGDIAKLLFNEAISEPNFRYSAARLCKILEEEFPFFRTALHLHADTLIDQNTPVLERDLALTLAELYAQSNCDNMYGKLVVQTIKKIVAVENLDNIKCVCQVLKLTGAALDRDHRNEMNYVFNQLETVKSGLPSLRHLIDYVISLRSSNWGQVEVNNYTAVGDRYSSREGPIFYGPDGKELSEDEKQFLADNCIELFNEDLLDSDPDELFDPDNEMDEEVHAAFREFTKGHRKN